jgi:hypothetical protein
VEWWDDGGRGRKRDRNSERGKRERNKTGMNKKKREERKRESG